MLGRLSARVGSQSEHPQIEESTMQLNILAIVSVLTMTTLAAAQPSNTDGSGTGGGGQYGPPTGPPPNAIFDAIDADGDGVITVRELRRAVVALKQFDADQDGRITREEVMDGASPLSTIDSAMASDKDGDGKLSKSELPRHLVPMLKIADTNGDGALDRAELASVMRGSQSQDGGQGVPVGFNKTGFPGQGGYGGDPRPGSNLSRYDRNGDGHLSADELPPQMRSMLRGTDQNGDGRLSPEEMQAIQQRMNERIRGQRPMPPGVTVGPQGVNGHQQSR